MEYIDTEAVESEQNANEGSDKEPVLMSIRTLPFLNMKWLVIKSQ